MINLRQGYRKYIRIGLAALLIIIFYFCFQAIFSGEKGRIKRFIFEGKKATEAKNIFACARMVSRQYHDKYGNDYDSLIYIAQEVFAYYKTIIISIEKMDIKLDESKNHADVEIAVFVLCQSKDNRAEKIFEGDNGRFLIRLVKENKKWKLLETEFLEKLTIMGQSII